MNVPHDKLLGGMLTIAMELCSAWRQPEICKAQITSLRLTILTECNLIYKNLLIKNCKCKASLQWRSCESYHKDWHRNHQIGNRQNSRFVHRVVNGVLRTGPAVRSIRHERVGQRVNSHFWRGHLARQWVKSRINYKNNSIIWKNEARGKRNEERDHFLVDAPHVRMRPG